MFAPSSFSPSTQRITAVLEPAQRRRGSQAAPLRVTAVGCAHQRVSQARERGHRCNLVACTRDAYSLSSLRGVLASR